MLENKNYIMAMIKHPFVFQAETASDSGVVRTTEWTECFIVDAFNDQSNKRDPQFRRCIDGKPSLKMHCLSSLQYVDIEIDGESVLDNEQLFDLLDNNLASKE